MKEVVSKDSSHVSASFSMKPYNFNHDTYLNTQTSKDVSPMTTSSPGRNDKKEKENSFPNLLVFQVKEKDPPMGNYVGFLTLL